MITTHDALNSSPRLALTDSDALQVARADAIRCLWSHVAAGLDADQVCADLADRIADEIAARGGTEEAARIGIMWHDERGDLRAWWTRDPRIADAAEDGVKAAHMQFEGRRILPARPTRWG